MKIRIEHSPEIIPFTYQRQREGQQGWSIALWFTAEELASYLQDDVAESDIQRCLALLPGRVLELESR